MTDRSIIQEVRARTDLIELVGQYVPLRRQGSSYVARCPFHDEKTPSFSVSPDKGFYFCFGCKASGDAIGFYLQMEGVTFPEALRALAERAGLEVPETRDPERIAEERRQRDVGERLHMVCEAAAEFYEQCLETATFSELARGALEERGVTAETAKQFRLGYAPAEWDALAQHLRTKRFSPADAELAGMLLPGRNGSYDRFRHRLMFPVFDRGGRVVAFSGRILPVSEEIPEGIVPTETGKYVNSPETPIYHKGELLYGLANARMSMRQKAEAIVVEGNFDVVQMHQHGFRETVAPLGTSFTEAQAKLLRRFAETAVLIFDGDDAGRKAARAAHPVCAKVGLLTRVGVLPLKMDPDSYLRSTHTEHGHAGMQRVIGSGVSILEWLILDGSTFRDNVQGRLAPFQALAPLIATVRNEIELNQYVKLAAKVFFLDEREIRSEINKARSQAAQEKTTPQQQPSDLRSRPILTQPLEDDRGIEVLERRRRKFTSTGLEALLRRPDLLETQETVDFIALMEPTLVAVAKTAVEQWTSAQRIDGAALIELCPTPKARDWVATKLVATEGEIPTDPNHWANTLRDALIELRVCEGKAQSMGLKWSSAKAGIQGDPASEVGTLNEQLRLKRELVRSRADKAPEPGRGSGTGPGS
jgi:DNA primase